MKLVAAMALLVASTAFADAQTNTVAARIDRILREVPLIDGHNQRRPTEAVCYWNYRSELFSTV